MNEFLRGCENLELGYLIAQSVAGEFESDAERLSRGVLNLKRNAMGRFGKSVVKTSDEMAELFFYSNVAKTLEESHDLIPRMMGHKFEYGNYRELTFEEVGNGNGEKGYRMSVYRWGS